MIQVSLKCQVVLIWGMCIYNLSNTTQDHRVKSGGPDKGKEATTFSGQLLAQASQANLLHVWVRDSMAEKSKQICTFALKKKKKTILTRNVKPDFQKFTSSSHMRNRHFHSTLKWLHVLLSLAQHSHLPTIQVTPLNIYLF